MLLLRIELTRCGAVGSALALGARSRRFKSCHLDQRRCPYRVGVSCKDIFSFVRLSGCQKYIRKTVCAQVYSPGAFNRLFFLNGSGRFLNHVPHKLFYRTVVRFFAE